MLPTPGVDWIGIEAIDERLNDSNTIVFGDVLVQKRRKQRALCAIDSLDKALHPDLPAVRCYPFDRTTTVSLTQIATFSHSLDPKQPLRMANNALCQCATYARLRDALPAAPNIAASAPRIEATKASREA